MSQEQNIYTGRAAEFFAAYTLELAGLRVTHVDLPYDDLWVAHPDGDIIRVQVKSARKPHVRKDRSTHRERYNFKTNDRKYPHYHGVYVFVALDLSLLLARRWDDRPPVSYKIKPKDFTLENQIATLTREFKI